MTKCTNNLLYSTTIKLQRKANIMNIDNIVSSTLKVTASENVDIQQDLEKADSSKTLEQLIHEEKENTQETRSGRD